MTPPDLPLIGPLHASLTDASDLLGVALVVLALLSAVGVFAVHDLRTAAADRAAGTGGAEGAGWFWAITEPPADELPTAAVPAVAEMPAEAASPAGRRGTKVRTKVA